MLPRQRDVLLHTRQTPQWREDDAAVGVGEARVLTHPSVLAEGVDGEHEQGVRGRWKLLCSQSYQRLA